MNNPLDSQATYERLDSAGVADSIAALPDQLEQVLQDSVQIQVPAIAGKVREIVINGMGGSNLGARILQSVFADMLKVPVIVTPGYEVPAFIGKNTLYIISSYSGTTEEPISTFNEVKKRGAQIFAIGAQGSGSLQNLIKKHKLPHYLFDPRCNPAGQPRLGVGYSIFGISVMLAKAGLFRIKVEDIRKVITDLRKYNAGWKPKTDGKKNAAKQIAVQLYESLPIIIGAEFLEGNIHALRNQFCENSKNFAGYLTIPELNHYAMEGLSFPGSNPDNLVFLFFESALYHPRVQRRMRLTREVVGKNKIHSVVYKLRGATKLAQSFELLQLGGWITYYLGLLNNVDPVNIPWVDWFKKELK